MTEGEKQNVTSICDDKLNKFKIHSETFSKTFAVMNEREVEDISLTFFYKPHTILLLLVSILGVMYFAFIR